MTLDLAAYLRLPADGSVSDPLLGKPVLYMVMRVAGLPKLSTATASKPRSWTTGDPYVTFVLHDPASMRVAGEVTWVAQGSAKGGFVLTVISPLYQAGMGNDLPVYAAGFNRICSEFSLPPVGSEEGGSDEEGGSSTDEDDDESSSSSDE